MIRLLRSVAGLVPAPPEGSLTVCQPTATFSRSPVQSGTAVGSPALRALPRLCPGTPSSRLREAKELPGELGEPEPPKPC